MTKTKTSGQTPYSFALRNDLYTLPHEASTRETNLHGGFAADIRPGFGEIYYGMPGAGIMRVEADLKSQVILKLPPDLESINFHSTKIGDFDGKKRLFLPANNEGFVVVLDLDGKVDFTLPRPVFEEYQAESVPYHPTDTTLVNDELYIADGYGANYISSVELKTLSWQRIFGGMSTTGPQNGKFNTAHGININPVHGHFDIADRPNSRIQAHAVDGKFLASNPFPGGAFLCGTSYVEHKNRWLGVIGCLQDPVEGRPAPIYIFDAQSYELISVIRPKEELGVEPAQHLHNVIFHVHQGVLFLVCQSWNPGHYFVLEML